MRVERQLEAARLQVGHSVNDVLQVGQVGPHRKGRRGKAPVAGRRPEEEHFLARGLDAVAQHLGKEARQPGSTGENESPGLQRAAIAQPHVGQSALAGRRRDGGLKVGSAGCDHLLHQREHRASRHHRSARRLELSGGDAFERDLRVPLRQLAAREVLDPPACAPDRLAALARVAVVAADQLQHADAVQDGQRSAPRQVAPEAERGQRHARVDLVLAVPEADDARLPARAGAGVGRSVRVDDEDAAAGALQVPGGPGPEDAGADHRDVVTAGAASGRRGKRGHCGELHQIAPPDHGIVALRTKGGRNALGKSSCCTALTSRCRKPGRQRPEPRSPAAPPAPCATHASSHEKRPRAGDGPRVLLRSRGGPPLTAPQHRGPAVTAHTTGQSIL